MGLDLITLAQFQGSEMSPGLFQGFMEGCRLSPLVIEHSAVIMSAGSHSRRSQIEYHGWSIFDSRFTKFVFRTSGGGEGGITFLDLTEDSDNGCPSSVTVRMEYLFAFQF